MTMYIAILRGINVGGRRKVLMADLKTLCQELDFTAIITYIQSGNVVFEAQKEASEIALLIQHKIKEKYAFDVPVIVKKAAEIGRVAEKNPFLEENPITQLHLTFLASSPSLEAIEKIKMIDTKKDKFEIMESYVFVCCEGKYSDSKLTNQFFESKLKTTATTRNWKTVNKLVELSNGK